MKLLRDLIVEKQSEAAGLIAPRVMRETAATALPELFAEYKRYLTSCDLSEGYVTETIRRLGRITAEANWKYLSDIRPDSFLKWRATLKGSMKTIKEYQISINALALHEEMAKLPWIGPG